MGRGDRSSANLIDVLEARASADPDALALRFLSGVSSGDRELSNAELCQGARGAAARIAAFGSPGDRWILKFEPGLEFVLAFLGCLYAGRIPIPIVSSARAVHRAATGEIAIRTAAVGVLGTSRSLVSIEESDPSPMARLTRLEVPMDVVLEGGASPQPAPDLAFLQFTSGSTSAPKGVMVTHENLMAGLGLIAQKFGHSSESCVVSWLPHHHDMGLVGGILSPLFSGCAGNIMSPLSVVGRPIRWLQAIDRVRATTSGGPMFGYEMVASRVEPADLDGLDLSSWETAFVGAEPVRAEGVEAFLRVCSGAGLRPNAVYPCYGLAEATLMVSGGELESPIRQQAPAGRGLAEAGRADAQYVSCGSGHQSSVFEIRSVETFARCREREVGEVWVSGPILSPGYWDDEEATARVFVDEGESRWLRTGDLGFVDGGELFVTGRLKDMTIHNGQNFFPEDLEYWVSCIDASFKLRRSIAFAADSEEFVIVHEAKRSHDADAIAVTVRDHISKSFGFVPRDVVIVPRGQIPVTSSGKVQRSRCRAMYESGELDRLNAEPNPQA